MANDGEERKPPVEMQAEEARLAFSDCLDRVGLQGERIIVTRFGKPLVGIVSIADLEWLENERKNAA